MVTAIFPAAGQGKRMGGGKNKVLREIGGEPILVRTLKIFSRVGAVNHLLVAAAPGEVQEIEAMLAGVSELLPYQIVVGGSQRQYSIANCLKVLPADADMVLIHDAARPLVTIGTIEKVIAATARYGAAIAAVREKNTMKLAKDNLIVKTVSRENLWEAQTPQGFKRELILRAFAAAAADNFLGTDDASLVERLGEPVAIVESDYLNIKLTTREDLPVARAVLAQAEEDEA